ncbi:MAG: DNA polymerase III subunit alpha [Acidimicrobiales bacterium]
MSWFNPPVPWSEIERRLSDRPQTGAVGSDDDLSAARPAARPGDRRGDHPGARPGVPGRADPVPPGADGGDSPAWSRHRAPYRPPARSGGRSRGGPAYAELHCHTCFSFLDGASHPEELAEEADRLGLEALAVTDHDGFYGVVRFAEAARALGLPTVFGAELTLGRTTPQLGVADPGVAEPGAPSAPRRTRARGAPVAAGDAGPRAGGVDRGDRLGGETHLVVLARDPRGYALLGRAITEAQLRGEKGAPRSSLADLAAIGGTGATPGSGDRDHWLVLTGCRKGAVPRALVDAGPAAAEHELRRLVDVFGPANVAVELWDHGDPLDSARNDALAELAVRVGVDVVATNNVHYATPARRPLATALAAVRARRSLDEIDGWLPAAAGAHLRSGAEQARRFARYPGVVERAADLGRACAFDLSLVAPSLPPFPCPVGHDEMSWLRQVTEQGAERRYGRRGQERVPGAYAQIDHELALVDQLGFPGYFLVVWDLVEFCRRSNIYCQGRGSAANSAVCYALGITNADAVSLGLLFERFLSPERDGPPDIDIDIESNRREEVIQYVYDRHGRTYAAQVANVITYRAKSAVRDMAKALGYAPGQQDAWSKQLDRWSGLAGQVAEVRGPGRVAVPGVQGQVDDADRADDERDPRGPAPEPSPAWQAWGGADGAGGSGAEHPLAGIPPAVLDLAVQVEDFPRHLGIHSGGMVMCDRPVGEVCPVEWARMEGRSVLQWDKDDCAAVGLVKFDLLGLGMLTALHGAVDLVADAHGVEVELATIPQDDAVYDMLCEADSVGVFQVESRAQMATLPRLRPRTFYDLVVEVALIRPGPIQGGSVHPYIRRRNGQEPVTYLHPLLEPALAKTLGVPLFQEQLMQLAIDVAGFTPAEADQLRQAMGSKRSQARMQRLRERLYEGMAANGITGEVADQIYDKLAAFANYGFPESHSVSFAYLVYASSWIKRYFPAAFCAALLDAQPMGFYSPHSLVQDAERHGVTVHTPDLAASGSGALLVWDGPSCEAARVEARPRHPSAALPTGGVIPPQPAVRLGLGSVRGLGRELAERIVLERDTRGPYLDMEDLKRRIPELTLPQLEALATAGAFGCFRGPDGAPLDRRRALWVAGAVAQAGEGRLPGIVTGVEAPPLPGLSRPEEATADLWATGVAPDGHPTRFLRADLDRLGVVAATDLPGVPSGSRVLVAGVVTHRQRPATAGGTTFVNLEDETGLINVVCSKGCWSRYRTVARGAPALLVRGRLEQAEGVVNVVADKLEPLPVVASTASRDFR